MDLTTALAGLLAIAVGLICLGLALIPISLMRKHQEHLRERFAGSLGEAVARRPFLLRRDARTRRWPFNLLGLSPASLAALSAEMRRISLLFLMGMMVISAIALYQIANVNVLLGAAAGAFLAFLSWVAWLRYRQALRRGRIDDAVPEAIDMVVRTLRVGLPIGASLQAVARDLSGPLAEEFGTAANQISYGKDVVSALYELADRCENQSMRFFAAAVSIQYSSGGNLAEVLERLSAIARGRQQMRRKVRAITAEAKWSGLFLSLFPPVAMAALLAINPNYFAEISDKPFFKPMLVGVTGLLLLNFWFMRRMARIE